MTPNLLLFLAIGTILMGIPIVLVAKRHKVPVWKGGLVTFLLTIVGTLGTFLMFYIENCAWGGLSFYGAVFFVPIAFGAASLILRISYAKVMDMCAIGECIMLALMKVHCILSGCCIGRVLFHTADGVPVLFPSREVELITALVLFVLLFYWGIKGKHCGRIYAYYLLLYGSSRFVLNIFREAWTTSEMILPYGNIWSLVAIVLGLAWLLYLKRSN